MGKWMMSLALAASLCCFGLGCGGDQPSGGKAGKTPPPIPAAPIPAEPEEAPKAPGKADTKAPAPAGKPAAKK